MQKKHRRILSLLLALVLTLGLAVTGFAAGEDTVTITVLQTSDLHGMVNPFDYASNKESKTSLAHVAAVVAQERTANPNLLLIDTGDTIQANYIQEFRTEVPNPMISALNYLKYDAWILGNHEFNFEFKNLEKAISEFKGATLAGNIYKADGSRWQDAYQIFEVDGVKVAILGINAPHVPQWEKSDSSHYNDMKFTAPMDETAKILKELEGKADVIVGAYHYGLEGEYGVEGMEAVVTKYADQLDGVFLGHAHAKVEETIAGVPVLEPANNGQYVGKLSIVVEKQDGKWVVNQDETTGVLIDSAAVTPDEAFLKEFKALDEKSQALAAAPVGEVGETFMDPINLLPGIPHSVIEDNPITDLVNMIQMKESGADVSLAAIFDASSNLVKGPFLNRDSVKIYKYDNTLFAVKIDGKTLVEIMERQAGGFFNPYTPGDVTISFNPDIRLYNYDMFSGVNYEIDISKPVGERIVNVTYQDAPLKDDQELVLALNNYRYGGLVTAGLINESDVVYEGGAVRDMITDYVSKLDGPLMPVCDNNWKIVGADLDDPQKDLIFSMVEKGELSIPTSEDGRTPNIASLNGPALRAAGKLPALEGEAPVVTPAPEPTPAPQPEPVPQPEPTPMPQPEPAPAGQTYTVKSGDNLWKISQQVYGTGTKWNTIYQANADQIKNPSMIQVGQVITIPAA